MANRKRRDMGVTVLTFAEMLNLPPISQVPDDQTRKWGRKAKQSTLASTSKCEICGSKDINILGAMCRRCGADLADPYNNFKEECGF